MRTLKKALSLVLVLAMVFALAVPGFAADTTKKASSFKDYSKVTNKEAVDVLTAIGVINGNADGTFAPEGNFTRAEAATMITYLTLGKTVANALPVSATKFSDVPATHWAAKYVQYCADAGIVAGVGNGKFDPDAKLTATQWSLMLLGALGYNAKNEGIGGEGWEIATTKLAMKAGVASAEELTATFNRDMAAKFALNTLKANVVEYESNGTNITIGNTTINTGASKATPVTTTATYGKNISTDGAAGTTADPYTVQFGELHFQKVEVKSASSDGIDALGRPAHSWYNGTAKVGTYSNTAAATYVVNKLATDNKLTTYVTGNDYLKLTLAGSTNWKINKDFASVTANTQAQLGDTIEVYTNDAGKVTDVVVVRETAAQITDVKANTGKAAITVNGEKVVYQNIISVDTNLDGTADKTFNEYTLPGYTSDYAKGTYLSVVLDASNDIISSKAATTVQGAITAWNATTGNATVAGTKYSFVNTSIPGNGLTIDFKTGTYDVVLNSNGFVTGVKVVSAAAATLDDVVYTNGRTWNETSSKYGFETKTYYAQVVDLKGTVSDVVVGGYKVVDSSTIYTWGICNATISGGHVSETTADTIAEGLKVMSKSTTSDQNTTVAEFKVLGTTAPTGYTFGTVTNSGLTMKTSDTKLDGKYIASTTGYMMIKGDGAATKAVVSEGGVNYTTTSGSEKIFVITKTVNSNQELVNVVIAGSTLTTTTSDMFYVPAATTTTTNGGYLQTVYNMKGEKSEIVVKSADKAKTGFVTYTVDENKVYSLTAATTAIGATADWNKTAVVDTGLTFAPSYFADRVTLTKSSKTLADIPAADMVVVDVRADNKKNGFNGEITSIGDMTTATKTYYNGGTSYYYAVEGAAYVTETGAVVFFVTGTVQGAAVV